MMVEPRMGVERTTEKTRRRPKKIEAVGAPSFQTHTCRLHADQGEKVGRGWPRL